MTGEDSHLEADYEDRQSRSYDRAAQDYFDPPDPPEEEPEDELEEEPPDLEDHMMREKGLIDD